jgi:hypothetical protein
MKAIVLHFMVFGCLLLCDDANSSQFEFCNKASFGDTSTLTKLFYSCEKPTDLNITDNTTEVWIEFGLSCFGEYLPGDLFRNVTNDIKKLVLSAHENTDIPVFSKDFRFLFPASLLDSTRSTLVELQLLWFRNLINFDYNAFANMRKISCLYIKGADALEGILTDLYHLNDSPLQTLMLMGSHVDITDTSSGFNVIVIDREPNRKITQFAIDNTFV